MIPSFKEKDLIGMKERGQRKDVSRLQPCDLVGYFSAGIKPLSNSKTIILQLTAVND